MPETEGVEAQQVDGMLGRLVRKLLILYVKKKVDYFFERVVEQFDYIAKELLGAQDASRCLWELLNLLLTKDMVQEICVYVKEKCTKKIESEK